MLVHIMSDWDTTGWIGGSWCMVFILMFWCVGGAGGVGGLGEPSGLLPSPFLAHYECL